MQKMKIEDIVILEHLRKRQPKDLDNLVQSIKELGLLNPITVNQGNWLIAGYHRLLACKALGWTEVPVNILKFDNVQGELAQIDENIVRNNLTALQMALQLKRRKELYEIQHPDSTRYAKTVENLRNQARELIGNRDSRLPIESFSDNTAKSIGKSQDTIQNYVRIANNLSMEVAAMLKDTPTENKLYDLLELAKIKDPERQKELIQKIIDGEIKSIRGYLDRLRASQRLRKVDLTKKYVKTTAYMRLLEDFLKLESRYYKLQADTEKANQPASTDDNHAA